MMVLRWLFAAGAFLAISIAVVPAGFAQVNSPFDLNHFKCYITRGNPPEAKVLLQDQFDAAAGVVDDAIVRYPVRLCNPVEKRRHDTGEVTPIRDIDHHLTIYLIGPSDLAPTRRVRVTNQFGTRTIRVFQAEVLAVPTQKPPHGPPDGLDHFKCYRAYGASVAKLVDLRDQFHTETNVTVTKPFGFCNPVRKTHGTITTPITNPEAHLVCYTIKPRTPFSRSVPVINQFGTATLLVREADLLCVPSQKVKVVLD